MHSNIDTLFSNMWDDYVTITPSAHKIHALLAGEENTNDIVNDHVAFRTFALDKTRLDKLAAHFLALGYEAKGDYDFEAKKLTAKHFEHPDDTKPKVFISELRVNELSETAQTIIKKLVAQMPESVVDADICTRVNTGTFRKQSMTHCLTNQNTLRGWPRGDSAQITLL